jgi:hypothetical protein
LSGSDQPDQQGGAAVADGVDGVVVDGRCADPVQQLVDEVIDLGVIAGETSYRICQPRRGAQSPAIQPIRSLGDGDVFPKVERSLLRMGQVPRMSKRTAYVRVLGARPEEIAVDLVGLFPAGRSPFGDWRRDSRTPSIGSEGSGRGA